MKSSMPIVLQNYFRINFKSSININHSHFFPVRVAGEKAALVPSNLSSSHNQADYQLIYLPQQAATASFFVILERTNREVVTGLMLLWKLFKSDNQLQLQCTPLKWHQHSEKTPKNTLLCKSEVPIPERAVHREFQQLNSLNASCRNNKFAKQELILANLNPLMN